MNKIKLKELFDKIALEENHEFKVNEPYINKTKFEVETEDGFSEVVSMIIKKDIALKFNTEYGEVLVSNNHRILTNDGVKYCSELKVNDILHNKNGDVAILDILVGEEETVYDLTLDNSSHLYYDSKGFIHHNTWHITSGPRSLAKLLGPEGDKWTYHSGTKAAPFSFYKTLFSERDKIIVFDEADSILKNPDIIMMLKPILDTSGSNYAEYMSGTFNMFGKSTDEIDEYCLDVDIHMQENDKYTLPSKFKFTGGMIFISNMRADQIEQAIMSRSIFIDIHLAQQDVLKRINSIMRASVKSSNEYSESDVDEVMESLSGGSAPGAYEEVTYMTPEYARKHKQITVRAAQLALILKKSGLQNWADLAAKYA